MVSITYNPLSMNAAHNECRMNVEPNSVITKLPSAEVGVLGIASLFKRNNLPFERPQATRFKEDRYNRAFTLALLLLSKAYENNLYPSVALQ